MEDRPTYKTLDEALKAAQREANREGAMRDVLHFAREGIYKVVPISESDVVRRVKRLSPKMGSKYEF